MARGDWQNVFGNTNNNNVFFTGIRWRYRDDLFGATGYPEDRIASNTDIIEYQPFIGRYQAYTSNYYVDWLTSFYKYSYNTESGQEPESPSNQVNIATTFRFDKAYNNTYYYLTQGNLSAGNVMNTASSMTSRIIQIPHCNDGTSKIRLYFYFAGNYNTYFTYAETNQVITLETIPRASSITVSDANIGSATNIVINKASSSFKTSIFYKASGENSWTQIVDKTENQVYGWTVPTSFYQLIPNDKTIACQFYAETYLDNSYVGTSDIITATFTATGNPIINSITAIDMNQTCISLTGNNSNMIRYASDVKISVSSSSQNSSSISSIKINGTSAVNGEVTFNGCDTNSFEVVVTDSRGYTTSQIKTMTMVDYIPLTITSSIVRNHPTDGKVKISYSGNYFNSSFGLQNNTLTVQYRYKLKGGSFGSWINLSPTKSGNTYYQNNYLISGFDYTKQYEFEIQAIDQIKTVSIIGITVAKGKPVINWDDSMFNVNGDIYQNDILIDNIYLKKTGGSISGNLSVSNSLSASSLTVGTLSISKASIVDIIYPINSIYMSVDSTSPETLFGGTWERLKDRFLLGAGDTYTNGASGGSDSHTHNLNNAYVKANAAGNTLFFSERSGVSWTYNGIRYFNGYTNGSGTQTWGWNLGGTTDSTNSMPPYLVVYMWKRIG